MSENVHTVSAPHIDPRTAHKRSPDWIVAVRKGANVRVHRFADEQSAQAFTDANTPTEE